MSRGGCRADDARSALAPQAGVRRPIFFESAEITASLQQQYVHMIHPHPKAGSRIQYVGSLHLRQQFTAATAHPGP
jgi:hypothetical protein